MKSLEQKKKEYAALLIEVGLGIKKGMELYIHAPVDVADFARLCVSAAYDAGAKDVTVVWSDDFVTREHFLRAEDEVFDTTLAWRMELLNGESRRGVPRLFIEASDPMNLAGVDPERILRNAKAKGRDLAEFYRLETTSFFPWCIASVPIESWAARVFPDASDKIERLWDAILSAVRVEGKGDAVARWREHLATLKARTDKLNAYRFRYLRYENALGTRLTVELPEGHLWQSGEETTPAGHPFVANMPTEEIFTSPLKTGVNGIVYAAMPLVEDGNVIRDFHFVIREGKIVEVHAREGEEILKNAIAVDEGACYLGEVALIAYDSPIRRQNILFYETLFDENASCHLAFGAAYPCIEGGAEMSEEELAAHGLNVSTQHTDFMIGTADLSVTGITEDGKEIAVMKDGNFCF
ncbi:MAG: aminopeptidase [Clostridia bacterium]|nr:aminopeptidase [Clostridia bacterium]